MIDFRVIVPDAELPLQAFSMHRPDHMPQRGDLIATSKGLVRVVDYRWSAFTERAALYQWRIDLICEREDDSYGE